MRCGGGKVPNIYRDLDLSLKEDWVNLVDCPGCAECQCPDCLGTGERRSLYARAYLGDCPTCNGTGRKVSDEG